MSLVLTTDKLRTPLGWSRYYKPTSHTQMGGSTNASWNIFRCIFCTLLSFVICRQILPSSEVIYVESLLIPTWWSSSVYAWILFVDDIGQLYFLASFSIFFCLAFSVHFYWLGSALIDIKRIMTLLRSSWFVNWFVVTKTTTIALKMEIYSSSFTRIFTSFIFRS